MKIGRLFLIAGLLASVAVIGCSDDATGTGGTAGSGGTAGTGGTAGGGGAGAEPCTGGFCETADIKIDCEAAVTTCIADAELDLTEAQCEAASTELYCNIGTGGAGGAGGNGGNGGGGGTSGEVDGCNESLCATDQARRDVCEEFVPACIVLCESEDTTLPCNEMDCIGFAIVFICNEQ